MNRPPFSSCFSKLTLPLLCLSICTPAYSAIQGSGENIALHRKVSLYPVPNYPECTDGEDDKKLTDGVQANGRIWAHKSTVGWQLYSSRIVIDLEQVEPIDKVVIHTVGGGAAGVFFPRSMKVYVSDNNHDFYLAGSLKPTGFNEDGAEPTTHAFSLDHLRTRGRYVMVSLDPNGTMVFTDEVQVIKGDFATSSVEFTSSPIRREELTTSVHGMTPETYTRGHFPVSPHIAWATPLSSGAIKGIIMNFSNNMRDVAEIAQRVDIDYVPVSHWSYYAPPEALPLISREQIEQALPGSELMVVGAYRWNMMPPDLLEKIKTRVRAGMGLICVVREGEDDWIEPIKSLFEESPIEHSPAYLEQIAYPLIPGYRKPKGDHFKLAKYGAGRVAIARPSDFTRRALGIFPSFELQDYVDRTNGPLEYYFAAFSKLMIWAAAKESERIADLQVALEKATVRIVPGSEPSLLKAQVRNSRFEAASIGEQAVPAKGGTFEFAIPSVANGRIPVEFQLIDSKGAIIDFGSGSFVNTREAKIRQVTAKPFYAPGKPIELTAKVDGELSGLSLTLTLLDTDDRQVADVIRIPVAEADTKVSIPYPRPLTLAAKVSLELRKEDQLLDSRLQRVWIDLPATDDFTVLGWYALDQQPGADFCMRMLRSLGVDHYVALAKRSRAENGAYGNVRFGTEELAPLRPPAESHPTLELVNCPSNPAYRQKVTDILSGFAKDVRPYGVLEWSIGDEERLGTKDYCVCQYCLAGFRDYLKEQYSSLEKLNESWESSYSAWEEIVPTPLEKVNPDKSIGSWLDHRRFMESLFAGYHRHSRGVVNKEIPAARIGMSGSQEPTSRNGYDWWKLMNAVDHLSGYGGMQIALQRSFLQPNTFFTTFLGYDYTDEDEQAARGRPWEVIFSGANGINYYTLISHTQNCPLIRPDLSMTRQGNWFFEEIKELKAGVGKLFMSAKYENDGIAIHYSPASLHVATATGLSGNHQKKRDFLVNSMNLCKLLNESHYQYNFVHEAQMAEGALSRYKVLFLPWSSAISATEEKAIREFVANGGTVIADSYCGLRDEHGKRRASLDDLFGIRQTSSTPALLERRMVFKEDAAINVKDLTISTGAKDLELAGATPEATAGGSPALLVHRVGKGKAIFLNANFSHYSIQFSGGIGGEVQLGSAASQDIRKPIRHFVSAILKDAGVNTPVTISSETHSSSDVAISRFTLGDSRLIGFSRKLGMGAISHNDAMQCKVHLEAPMHVYETRKGRYIGYVSELDDSFVSGVAKVYALLPYKVDKLTISGSSQVAPGTVASVKATLQSEGKIGPHVINFTIKGPDGEVRPLYTQNILSINGETKLDIPFAYNDPAGEWTVIAKDVATGHSNRFTLTLKARETASQP